MALVPGSLLPCPPEKDTDVTKKKVTVIDRGVLCQKAKKINSRTLILYKQSETNCPLETSQDFLNMLERSIYQTINVPSLVSALLGLNPIITFSIK